MSNSRPAVSVIVPHYNDLTNLDECLDRLSNQTMPRDAFEIVVADNASPQGEAAVAKVVAGRARLVIVPEKGAGPARNGGVAASRGARLAFTDSDCRVSPDWLSQGLAALDSWDVVGGRMRVLIEDPEAMTGPEAFEKVFAFNNERYVKQLNFSVTANLFCARAVYEAVGPFLVGVSEDKDWCQRAVAAGFRLGYADKAIAGHPARRTWSELRRKWERLNAESFALYRLRPAGRLIWLLRTLALPVSAIANSPKVLLSGELDSLGQRVAALATLYRLRFWRTGDALRLLLVKSNASA